MRSEQIAMVERALKKNEDDPRPLYLGDAYGHSGGKGCGMEIGMVAQQSLLPYPFSPRSVMNPPQSLESLLPRSMARIGNNTRMELTGGEGQRAVSPLCGRGMNKTRQSVPCFGTACGGERRLRHRLRLHDSEIGDDQHEAPHRSQPSIQDGTLAALANETGFRSFSGVAAQ